MDFQEAINIIEQDNLAFIALPIFILAVLFEMYFDRFRELNLYQGRDTLASIGMLIITAFVEFIPKVLAFMLFYILHQWSPLQDIVGRQAWAWVLLIVFDDFSYYWFHRMNHEVRLFWAGHVSHHSSRFMNFGTALRQGAGERIHKYLFWIWLPLLGFDPLMIFIAHSVNLIFQFWVHTDLVYKLPKPIEFIFNTPSHHRVHHASNVRYLDCNHAGIFILWDRLFGTFSEELYEEKPVYGLTQNIESNKLFHVATHEYASIWKDLKRASSFSEKLKYLFLAPGWSHDGQDRRAKVLRKNLLHKEKAI